MSLRLLFILMGLVTAGMIAAVVYTKIISPPEDRVLSVGESRSLDRVCNTHCAMKAEKLARETQSPEELEARARACVKECKAEMVEKLRESRRTQSADAAPHLPR